MSQHRRIVAPDQPLHERATGLHRPVEALHGHLRHQPGLDLRGAQHAADGRHGQQLRVLWRCTTTTTARASTASTRASTSSRAVRRPRRRSPTPVPATPSTTRATSRPIARATCTAPTPTPRAIWSWPGARARSRRRRSTSSWSVPTPAPSTPRAPTSSSVTSPRASTILQHIEKDLYQACPSSDQTCLGGAPKVPVIVTKITISVS